MPYILNGVTVTVTNGDDNSTIYTYVADYSLDVLDESSAGVSNGLLDYLESQGVNVLSSEYDPTTGELLITPLDATYEEVIEPVDAYLFQVMRGDKAYQCYADHDNPDLSVSIQGTVYRCILQT